jgi:hypothetical protein
MSHHPSIGVGVLLRVLVLLVLGGCGGGDAVPGPTETSTPTPTPTQSVPLADLVALSVQERGCIGNSCGPYRLDICVENRGDADAGEFPMTLEGRVAATVPGLAPAEVACFAVAYSWSGGLTGAFEVDPAGIVPDSNPDNNAATYPEPNPTGCDVLCTGPTPTPARIR